MAFPHPMSRLAAAYRKMVKALPVEVSGIALKEFKGNFRRQGYRTSSGVTAWDKRAGDKDQGRALLIKTGRLRRSLRIAPSTGVARVITNVPYAQIHNEGGTIDQTVTVRAHTRKDKAVKSHTRKMNTTIPARPYMISSDALLSDIQKHIDKRLTEIWKQS